MLASAKPLALKTDTNAFPPNFTVISASANDQISSSSPELKHGIFSFYLMKGMEGDADGNKDGKITRADILKGRGVIAKKGATVKKAQNGTLQPMGKNSRKVGEGKYVSEDGNYKLKFKGGSDTSAPTSAVQRRTLKGFLKGAPKAGFKTKMAKSGTSMKKCKYGCK